MKPVLKLNRCGIHLARAGKPTVIAIIVMIVIIPSLGWQNLSWGGEVSVTLDRPPLDKDRIPELIFDKPQFPVHATSDKCSYEVTILGKLDWKDRALAVDHKVVKVDPISMRFEYKVTLRSKATQMIFTEVGPAGTYKNEFLIVAFPDWDCSIPLQTPKRHRVLASAGVTSIQFQQTQINPYSAFAVTLKASYSYSLFYPRVDLGVNSYFTAFTFAASDPTTQARFLGINAKIGYNFVISDPWRFSVQTGIYYTTMFVTNNNFGFQNLMGPQLYPVVSRRFGNSSLLAYFKFSPVGSGFGITSLANNEIAGGLNFSHPIRNSGMSYSVGVDMSQLSLNFQSIQVLVNTASLSAGLSF